jgi:hypothetical protein
MTACRQCAKPAPKVNEYVPPTCGASECQEAEFRANQAENKPRRRRR